eukprot:jgi/Botrbrau1/3023/Bobra.0070s0019.1
MQAGSFFATFPRHNPFAKLLSFGSSSRKSSFDASAEREFYGSGRRAPFSGGSVGDGDVPGVARLRQSWWEWPGGAYVQVSQGEEDIYGVKRVRPWVHATKDAICIFYGHLSNTDELIERLQKGAFEGFGSNTAPLGDSMEDFAGHSALHESDSVEGCAADVVLRLCLRCVGDFPVFLSELQGQYAFVIYDSRRKQVLAARDPSGSVPLHVAFGDEGSVAFANHADVVPSTSELYDAEWRAFPPGHYIAGKNPTAKSLQQFALTPEELYTREELINREEMGDMLDDELPPTPRSGGLRLPNFMYPKHQDTSLPDGIFAVSL